MNASGVLRRYTRHLLMPEIGVAGQHRLASARVLVVGSGGLGSPVLQYLAAAGIGRIGIVDDDAVDETNLQRQTIFTTADIGRPKVRAAAEFIAALNPAVAVDAIPLRFASANAMELTALYDVVVDCTDRFSTRYLINDACKLAGKPDVYASIFRFDGQVSVFGYEDGPCYRCLYPRAPAPNSVPTCAEGGVLGVLPGIVGAWQANEVLKIILRIGQVLRGRLLVVDSLGAQTRSIAFERDPDCELCGRHPSITTAQTHEETEANDVDDIDPAELDAVLPHAMLLDVREPHESVLGAIDGAIEIPASQLDDRLHELDSAQPYVVACRLGVKSRVAVERLRDAGFTRVRHLRGGLLAYAAVHDDRFSF
ncbi:MAG: molybdopterin-synthase adenylyltransferase MoeB [Candidatus Eremiobacteraeota bacterium]|nr:molybdopterin-synthase adenylyltransferase MoeB [Candidatus Eremiobacteraeota bacterium]